MYLANLQPLPERSALPAFHRWSSHSLPARAAGSGFQKNPSSLTGRDHLKIGLDDNHRSDHMIFLAILG